MGAPFASIGGIASGLDTAGIVQSLMQLERRPMVVLQQRQQTYRQANEAWGQITTRLSTLRTATNKLTDPSWVAKAVKATSSNDQVARIANATGAQSGSLSFNVERLASAHQFTIGGSFASGDSVLGQGSLTLTRNDGADFSVDLAEGATLADAARALNQLDGISARVLRVQDGDHRLMVTSNTTGANGAFALAGDSAPQSSIDGLDGGVSQTLTAGQDAHLTIGGLDVFRSSNTITDLYDGVELRLTGTGAVTVEVQKDLDGATAQVRGVVDALNGLLTQLATASRTSATAGERGPLSGDPLVRELSLQLRASLSRVTATGGTYQSLGQIGVELTRDGRVQLNESKLRDALTNDPQAVASLLGKASSASNPSVEVTSAGRAEAGTYQLQLDTAPRVAAIVGASYTPPTGGSTKTFTIDVGDKTVNVTIDEEDGLTSALDKINQALALEQITTLTARESGGSIRLEATRAGSSGDFTVDDPDGLFDLGAYQSGSGAAGTLTRAGDGSQFAFTSSGQTVTLLDDAVRNLAFRLPLDVSGDLGTISVGDGFGSVLDRILRGAEGRDGSITRAREALDGRIRAADRSIEVFEQRLELRERTIRRQFTAMESAMAQFNSQASWLASQLGSMTQ